jgi:Spy/CpxP family protein refolding chaperone
VERSPDSAKPSWSAVVLLGEGKQSAKQQSNFSQQTRRGKMRMFYIVPAFVMLFAMVNLIGAAADKQAPESPHSQYSMIDYVESVKGLKLTDDQKTTLGELKKEYDPKFEATWQKLEGILTPEQKKAYDSAIKVATAHGVTAREARKSSLDSIKFTSDQKVKAAAIRQEATAFKKEIYQKILAVLTPAQDALLKEILSHRGITKAVSAK